MDNQFLPQAVEIVKQAITADQAGDYENALPLYKKSLEYFMMGMKYEKNPSARETIKTVFVVLSYIFIIINCCDYDHHTIESGRLYEKS